MCNAPNSKTTITRREQTHVAVASFHAWLQTLYGVREAIYAEFIHRTLTAIL